MTVDKGRIAAAVREILDAIGDDPNRAGLDVTPERVADSFAELFGGVGVDAADGLSDVGSTADVESTDPVIIRDLEFRSMCEHHLLPFSGIAHVAYVPSSTVLGLGHIARVVDIVSSRPQVQERLGLDIADALTRGADAAGVLVVLDARHECVASRGARQSSATAVTVTAVGVCADDPLKTSLLALIGRGDG
jgi:GTP cyclohydrolase I